MKSMKEHLKRILAFKPTHIIFIASLCALSLDFLNYEYTRKIYYQDYQSVSHMWYFSSEMLATLILGVIFLFISYRLYKHHQNKTAAIGSLLMGLSNISSTILLIKVGLQTLVMDTSAQVDTVIDLSTSLGIFSILSLILLICGSIILAIGLRRKLGKTNDEINLLLFWSALLSIFNIYFIGTFIVLWLLFEVKNKKEA